MRPDVDPDYDVMRGARMQALRLVDLPKLSAHRRKLAEGEALQAAEEQALETAESAGE
jgi:hypothetical protein